MLKNPEIVKKILCDMRASNNSYSTYIISISFEDINESLRENTIKIQKEIQKHWKLIWKKKRGKK